MSRSPYRRVSLFVLLVFLVSNLVPSASPSAQAVQLPEPLDRPQVAQIDTDERSANVPPTQTSPFGAFPLAFVENYGQSDAQVRFQVHGMGGTLFFTPRDIVLALPPDAADPTAPNAAGPVVRVRYEGAAPRPDVRAGTRMATAVNDLRGNDAAGWRTNLPAYGDITYDDLYPGIDLQYTGTDGHLKSTYVVDPGADPSRIQWRYLGAQDVQVDSATGDLVVGLPGVDAHPDRVLREHAPIAWQERGTTREPVEVQFAVAPDGRVGFSVGGYDRSRPLIIDPTLTYSTYLGGVGFDRGTTLAVDNSGVVYVAGHTWSTTFPTTGGSTSKGAQDVFVAKLNADGGSLVWSTYIGGSSNDVANDLAIDSSGNVYLTGLTSSTNFPVPNGYDTSFAGGTCGTATCFDAFVAKLTNAGSSVAYGSYLGGTADDSADGIAIDNNGRVVVVGRTTSSTFPTRNGYDTTFGGGTCGSTPCDDAFVTRLDPAVSGTASLLYGTFLGGSGNDEIRKVALTSTGTATVVGWSTGTFPTRSAYDSTYNGGANDMVVAQINPAATGDSSLVWSTYLGGSADDQAQNVALDSSGQVYLTGYTDSNTFPQIQAIQSSYAGVIDAVVAKLNPAATGAAQLVWSTYLGGNHDDRGRGIAVQGSTVYVTGYTRSSTFPVQHPVQATLGGASCTTTPCADAFVAALPTTGGSLTYSTYLGTANSDGGYEVAVDSIGAAYVTGQTSADGLATSDGYDTTYNGDTDAFVAKLSLTSTPVAVPVRINTGGPAQTVGSTSWSACSALGACGGFVTGGFAYSEADTITGIPAGMNNAIFQSEWTGGQTTGVPAGATAFTFEVPVTNGDYTVRLHFAELNKTTAGTRVFDVNLEGGAKELTSFDIFQEAGGIGKAIVREFPVTVNDGGVTIQFIRQVENAKVSAIEILAGTASTPTATATAVPPTATSVPPTATRTPTATATGTALPTATNTALPTATNTALPTATNTALPTATGTALPTATNTALPTATNTALPTATNTALPTATSGPCRGTIDQTTGKDVYVNSTYSGRAAYAVDDNLATYWGGGTRGSGWLYVDFGADSPVTLERVRFTISTIDGYSPIKDYDIQYSPDALTWSTIATSSVRIGAGDGSVEELSWTAPITTYRYWRLNIRSVNGSYEPAVKEIEFFSPCSVETPPSPPSVTLHASLNTTSTHASSRDLVLVVEARDANGNLVPSYRGELDINVSAETQGLPQAGGSAADYVFTAADAGRHVFSNWGFPRAGTESITIMDRNNSTRRVTIGTITVAPITLHVDVSPATVFAGEPVVHVKVSARDQAGAAVPGYRGTVRFSSTSSFTGLPPGGLGGATYTFTASDAGEHTWTGVTLNTAGTHTISVRDDVRNATSNAIAVKHIVLTVIASPIDVFAGEPVVEVTVEARDQDGALVPGYRGTVAFSSTSSFTGLPPGGLGGATYTFTATDAGRHTWTGVTLNTAGSQTISVRDGTRTATSNIVSVKAVSLVVLPSATTIFAGEPILDVTVEARDQTGQLVPGYRGAVAFGSSSTMLGLPQGGLGGSWYTFTADDAGRHTWTGVTLNTPGEHTISVRDGTRTATSAVVTVKQVNLSVLVSPATVFAGEPVVEVTVEARDQGGALVPGYRGAVAFSSTSAMNGLPEGGLGGSWYTFTANDAGQHTWTGVTLNTAGNQTISVRDGTRTATSNVVAVQAVTLAIVTSATSVFAGEPIPEVRVEVRDQAGALVPGYRGTVAFSSTSLITGLPEGGLGGATYTFTATDAGQHTWTNVILHDAGNHTISVRDGTRTATSGTITVNQVSLTVKVSLASVFPGEPIVAVTVEARDQAGGLVPGYRGSVKFTSTSAMTGLPIGGLGGAWYGFTADDAGQHTWTGVTLDTPGSQTISVTDGTRTATSNAVTVKPIAFRITWNATTAYVNDRTLALTIDVIDQAGNLVPGYRGAISMYPTVAMRNLPQATFSTPDYVFTEADAGRHSFPDLAFTEQGVQSVRVIHRPHPDITATSPSVEIILPPEPTPIPAGTATTAVSIPGNLPSLVPPSIPYGWGKPFLAGAIGEGWNGWQGKPGRAVPAHAGTMYVVSGVAQRGLLEWWPTTFYVCPWLGWEAPMTFIRESGGGIDYLPGADPTFTKGIGLSFCGGSSSYANGGSVAPIGPALSAPAPAGTQGVHINPVAAGNSIGAYGLGANAAGDLEIECDSPDESPDVADPIDTRSGEFYLVEHDLGVATGCATGSLQFERTYRAFAPPGGSLAGGWVHNFEVRVIPSGSYVMVQRPRGSMLVFQDVGGDVYATRAGSDYTLMKRAGGGWVLVNRDRSAEVFDGTGRLLAQQDPNGNQIWMTWESFTRNGTTGSRLARVDAPGGRYLWFGYDYYRPTRISVVGDNLGRTVRYSYDDRHTYDFIATGRLTRVTNPAGDSVTYEYADSNHYWLLTKKTDERGKPVFTNTYDLDGRVSRQVNNTGQDIALTYDVITDTAQIASRVGPQEAEGLDALLVTTTEDQTGRTVYTFGGDGLLRSVVAPNGATTRYGGYTPTRQPSRVTDGEGQTTQFSYTADGFVETATNADGKATSLGYDSWGRPTSLATYNRTFTITYNGPNIATVLDQTGREVRFSYADQAGWKNLLSSVSNAGSMTTNLFYDAAGDVVKVTDDLGRETILTYDGAGRPRTIRDAHGAVTTLDYRATNEILSIKRQADGKTRTTSFVYNEAGHLLSVTDPLSQTTTFTPDDAGRVTNQKRPDGRSIAFDYNTQSNLTALTPPDRGAHRFDYTLTGELEAYRPPAVDSGPTTTRYAFNLLEQLTKLTQPDGAETAVGYDSLGRTDTMTHTAGLTQLDYDPASGNVATLQSPDGTLTYAYDSAHRPTTTTWSGGISGAVEHGYNAQSLVSLQRVNSLAGISFHYDATGALKQAGALTLAYAAADGLLESTTLGVVTDDWTYNGFSEPRGYTATANGTTVYSAGMERDALGRITARTETIDGVAVRWSYMYDELGQLHFVHRNGALVAEYTYDANGNRTAIITPSGTMSASYDAQDRLLQHGATTFTYTANGEIRTATTNGQITTYGYDDFGNLKSATLPDGTTISYLIDGQGRRVGKQVNGTRVQGFLYADDLRPVAELDGTGAVVSQFVYASKGHVPDYVITGGVTYRIVTDHLGNPRFVVNTTTGVVVQQLTYDAWGRITQDTNPGFQPFGFAGGLYDQHTKLTHFGAREYDATTGRWTSKDPLGFGAGDPNLYRYVGNDPVNYVDPTGHIPFPVVLALIGLGSSFFGNLVGQLIANGRNWRCIRLEDAFIAAGFGFGAGLVAPYVAFTWTGAITLGAGTNLLQYLTTQWYHDDLESINGYDIVWNIGTGAAGGALGGLISAPKTLPFDEISPSWTRSWARALNNDAWIKANVGKGNFARTLGGALVSSSPNSLNTGCACP